MPPKASQKKRKAAPSAPSSANKKQKVAAAKKLTMLDLTRAIDLAARKHVDQRRKDKKQTPYINHPIGVMHQIVELGGVDDVATLMGAVLHDTVEDTETSLDELRTLFGAQVASIVDEVSDDKSLKKGARKRAQIEHARHASKQARLVKLSDKLYNLRDLLVEQPRHWDRTRAQGYFVWAWFVVDAMRGTNAGLEQALDDVFAAKFRLPDGKQWPCLPTTGGGGGGGAKGKGKAGAKGKGKAGTAAAAAAASAASLSRDALRRQLQPVLEAYLADMDRVTDQD